MSELDDRALLARVDERTKNIQVEVFNLRGEIRDKTERLEEIITDLKDQTDKTKAGFKEDFVSKESFTPVQRLVYGVVSIILTVVVGAIITLVVMK